MVVLRNRKGRGGRFGAGGGINHGHGHRPTLGQAAPPTYQHETTSTGPQLSRFQDPRSPPPATPTAGLYSSFDVGGLSLAGAGVLTTAAVASGAVTLGAAGDIFQLDWDVTETFTGTVTTTKLFNQAFDHFTIADSTGAIVWQQSGGVMQELTNLAFLSPTQGGSLGGSNTAVANQTTAQENVSILAGLRLPASRGPWKLTPYLNSISGAGGTQATADTVALRVGGQYASSVGGVTSYYVEQSNLTLNAGVNYFNQFATCKNRMLQGMFISGAGLTTTNNLDNVAGVYIEQNGRVIEPQTYGINLDRQIKAAFPAVTPPTNAILFCNPVLKSQFAINDSSQSYINLTAQATNITIGYYYLA